MKELIFKLNITTKYKPIDKILVQDTRYYDELYKLTKRLNFEDNLIYKMIRDKYEYLMPLFFLINNKSKFKKSLSNKTFLKYQPILNYYSYHEIYQLFLKNIKINKVISFANNDTMLMYLNYNNIKLDVIERIIIITDDTKTPTKNIYNNAKISYKILEEHNELLDIIYNDKYDFINMVYYDYRYLIHIYDFGLLNSILLNELHPLTNLIFVLKNLDLNGSAIMNIGYIVNKNNADIYLIAKKYFKESYLYYPESSIRWFQGGTYIILKSFIGISEDDMKQLINMYNEIQNKYSKDYKDYNKYENDKREIYDLDSSMKRKHKYLYGYLDTNLDNPIDIKLYQEIIDFNNKKYYEKAYTMQRLNQIVNIPEAELPLLPTNEQMNTSVLYCHKWKIEYNEYYNSVDSLNTVIGKNILSEIYGKIEPLKYDFKTSEQLYLVKTLSNINNPKTIRHKTIKGAINEDELDILQTFFQKKNAKLFERPVSLMERLTDIQTILHKSNVQLMSKLNITSEIMMQKSVSVKFDERKSSIHLTNKNKILKQSIKNKIVNDGKIDKYNIIDIVKILTNNLNINHECLVIFEVLSNVNLLSHEKIKVAYNDSNIPKCLNLYLEHNKKNITIEHHMQKHNIKSSSDFVNYYDKHHDFDLIIDTSEYNHNLLEYDKYVNILLGLISLKKNGNIIIKLSLPINSPPIFNLIYVCYLYFKELYIFKPILTKDTPEFYLIGKNITNNMDLESYIYLIDSYDKNVDLMYDLYQDAFVSQFYTVYKRLVRELVFINDKKIFYFENYDVLDKQIKFIRNEYDNEKRIDWLKYYKFVNSHN